MKPLSKLTTLTIIVMLSCLANQSKAQTTEKKAFVLSLGIETGLPTGNASNYSTFDLGGTIRLQYGITTNLAATFTTGGYHIFSKYIPGTATRYQSYGVGPIKGGIKGFVAPNIYLGAEAGAGFEVTEHNGFGQTKLLLSPALGYANKQWDFGIHYDSLTGEGNNYGVINLRVAYGFKL